MENELEKTVSIFSKGKEQLYKIVVCQKDTHKVYELNDFNKNEITFGRANDNDIVIKSNIISSHHGKFILGEGLEIVDNDSTNGILINGELRKRSILSNGDEIKIDNPDTSLDQRVVITVLLGTSEIKICPNCHKNLLETNNDVSNNNEYKVEKKTNQQLEKVDFCLHCGAKINNEQEFCPECGTKKGEISNKKCSKCGAVLEDGEKFCSKCGEKVTGLNNLNQKFKDIKGNSKKKKMFVGIIIFIVLIIIILGISLSTKSSVENDKPIKVDISMTSYSGTIEYILAEFDLDFDLVTMGANCYTGVQSGTFETEKYGILHTEFRYCKANKTTTFRIYNTEQDQELREAKPGELPTFDKYGYKISSASV